MSSRQQIVPKKEKPVQNSLLPLFPILHYRQQAGNRIDPGLTLGGTGGLTLAKPVRLQVAASEGSLALVGRQSAAATAGRLDTGSRNSAI